MSGSFPDSGGVNASIPLQAGQGVQQNPLASNPSQFLNTLQGINQLKLFPYQQQAAQLGVQQQQVDLATSQLKQRIERTTAGMGMALPLLVDKDGNATTGVSAQDIARTLADASSPSNGLLTAQQAAGMLQQLPEGGQDPMKNRQMLTQWYSSMLAAHGQSTDALTMLGRIGATRETGQETQTGTVGGPLTQNRGFVPSGSATPIYPSRAQGASPVNWVDKTGQPQQGTLAEYARQQGLGNAMGPAFNQDGSQAQPQGAPGAPQPGAGPFPPGYTGRLPQAPQTAPTGPIEGPAPGTVEPQQASGQQYAADQRAAGTFGQRVFPLKQAIGLLSNTDTGPGSETLNQFRSFLVSMSNQGLLPKAVTPDAIGQANFDELKKYMSNYITNLPFAAGSDARMAEAISGNPHATLSTIANQDLARVMVGLERFRQAQYLSFNQQHPNAPAQAAGQYGAYAAKFGTENDPRAFAYDLMSPEERTKLYNSLDTQEKQRYRASLKLAFGIPGLMQ